MDTWSSENITPLYQDCLLDKELDYHSSFMQRVNLKMVKVASPCTVREDSLPGQEASATGPYTEPVKTGTHDPF